MISRQVLLTPLALAVIAASMYAAPVRVACVGDSITAGIGTTLPDWDAYPSQLQRLLGDGYVVGNCGLSGSTLLNAGDKPYQQKPQFKKALSFKPDVVVIQLGTNDTKHQNWVHKEHFAADYTDLVRQFQALPSKPRIFVNLPPYVAGMGNYGINERVLLEALPLINAVAKDTHATVIDVHGAFLNPNS